MRLHRPPGILDWFDGMPPINDGTLYPTLGMIPGPICNFGSIFTELVNVFDPTGKNFAVRLEAFLVDAEKKYGVAITKTATQRRPEDAQKWHIAHMFHYNSFANMRPKNYEMEDGHRVIKWEGHLNKATLLWSHGMDWKDFLRDKNGVAPNKTADGLGWMAGQEPDKDKSKDRAYEILEQAGIATSDADRPHGAMVAPGFRCCEPCNCGGFPSKHTAGLACDVDMSGIHRLETALRKQKAGSLDGYLKEFGLKRPMTKEPWHIEATA